MGKKKLWSDYSPIKVAESIFANNMGRLGGTATVIEEVQREVYRGSVLKAQYWKSKTDPYHQLRVEVSKYLDGRGVAPADKPLYYAFAQKVAHIYAVYPGNDADILANATYDEFQDKVIESNLLDDIREMAREYAKVLQSMYHI